MTTGKFVMIEMEGAVANARRQWKKAQAQSRRQVRQVCVEWQIGKEGVVLCWVGLGCVEDRETLRRMEDGGNSAKQKGQVNS